MHCYGGGKQGDWRLNQTDAVTSETGLEIDFETLLDISSVVILRVANSIFINFCNY